MLLRTVLTRQVNTTIVVIPAKAGIQADSGCRIESGMTKVAIFYCRFNIDQYSSLISNS